MTQVYAVLYTKNGNFLIAKKLDKGYFFANKNGGGSIIKGGKKLNGAGEYALPGGKLNSNEDKKQGAIREFDEETAVKIKREECCLITTRSFKYWFNNEQKQYVAVYFKVKQEILKKIVTEIKNNLDVAKNVVTKIEQDEITSYDQIKKQYKNCPADNELYEVYCWNIENKWDDIKEWKGSKKTGWYYDILKYLKEEILNNKFQDIRLHHSPISLTYLPKQSRRTLMNQLTVTELVQQWMSSGDVTLPSSLPSVFELSDTSATARANYLGNDTSDPDASGIEIYSELQNLPTAVASILNHSQNRADFHPADMSPEVLATRYSAYISEIDNNPFLHLLKSEQSKQSFYSKDYNLLIDQVVNLYAGVTAQDLDALKDSIADMAKSVFGQTKSEDWKNLFSQSTLDISDEDNPILFIYYTSLHMGHDETGKSEVNEQDYMVRKTEYLVLPDLIKAHAYQLASLDKKSVDAWAGDSTSPERNDAKLCFTVKPFRTL